MNQCLSALHMAGSHLRFSLSARTCGWFPDEEFVCAGLVYVFLYTLYWGVCLPCRQNVILPDRQFFCVSISSMACMVPMHLAV